MKTFKCSFGDTTCEVQVTDDPPKKGSSHIIDVHWTGRRSAKLIRPYIVWMNSVNQIVADEWNKKILHAYQITRSITEAWVFEPGGKPKKVGTYYGDKLID